MFRALAVHNFRLYVSANLVSMTGTWMQRIGQDWLVLQLSGGSGTALGVVTALQFAPTLALSFYGGLLADRYDKRRMLMITQAVLGVLALALALLVATGGIALWQVFALALGLGVVSSLDTPARQSFVSEMVGPTLLGNAVSLNSTVFNGARLVGPAVAGGVIAASGGDTAPAFFVNAASFGATIVALALMRDAELQHSVPVTRARGQLRAALTYTRAHPDLQLAMLLAFVVGTFGFNSQITIALMAREVFGLGAGAFGLLSTAFAVGSLSGALLSTRRDSRPLQRFLLLAALAFGALTVVSGLMPTEWAYALLLVPCGAAGLVFSVACNSFVQLGVEPQMRGRILALYFMCFMGGTPVGAPLIGWVSEHLGARWGLVSSGLVVVVVAAVVGAVLSRGRHVRLETHVAPPSVRLHVDALPAAAVGTVPPVGAAIEEAAAEAGSPDGADPALWARSPVSYRGLVAPAVVNAWWVQLAAVVAMTLGTAWLMDFTMRAFSGTVRRPRLRRRDRRRDRRRPGRVVARRPAPVAAPQRRSVQAIAADLRRLRRELALVSIGSAAHRAGVLAAYDDVLVEAAGSLEVPHRLREAGAGEERDLERLRLAATLADTGLVISDPQDRG